MLRATTASSSRSARAFARSERPICTRHEAVAAQRCISIVMVRTRALPRPAIGEKRVPGVDLARVLLPSRRLPAVRSDWRPTATPAGVGASHDGVGLLTPALLLRQELGRQARADRRSGEDEEGRYRQTAASRRSASAATDLSRARI